MILTVMDWKGNKISSNSSFQLRRSTHLKHLSGNNNGLADNVALRDHHLLSKEDLAGRNFNTEITTSDHDTISLLQDLVEVGDALFVLNLDDDFDVGAIRSKDSTDVLDVLTATNKRSKDHVDAVLNTEQKILLVLLGESREIDLSLGQIDTLARGDVPGVQGTDADCGSIDGKNKEGEDAVINIDEFSGSSDFGQVGLEIDQQSAQSLTKNH